MGMVRMVKISWASDLTWDAQFQARATTFRILADTDFRGRRLPAAS
jgi:hypothetical protein